MNYDDQPKRGENWLDPEANPAAIRRVLSAVVASDQLSKAARLKDFLTYVVEEAIAGRSDTILGKTIAQDVYGRGAADSENAENLVRVDARRLRRKLEEYYEKEGAHDEIRVVLRQGGYAPTFVKLGSERPDGIAGLKRVLRRRSIVAVLGAGAITFVLIEAFIGSRPSDAPSEIATPKAVSATSDAPRQIERDALSQKSAASVHATNLCDQARGFLFPIADIGSQNLAMSTFTRAIETDPGLSCGYAGAAHAAATLAVLVEEGEESTALKQQASEMSRKAVELAPTDGWSQSAAAWAAFSDNRYQEANRLSAVAVNLAPNDGNVLDFRAMISILTGDFDEALLATDPDRRRDFGSFRFARRNLRAVAWFHLGEYEKAIQSLEAAVRNGDPVSALTLTFLAAAHQSSGDPEAAQRLLRELLDGWPNARPDIALGRLYATQSLAQQVLSPLSEAGWTP